MVLDGIWLLKTLMLRKRMQIWYHGTQADAALIILRDGFLVGTYFARNLQDALAFGGPYVFEVALDPAKFNNNPSWQLRTLEFISKYKIIALTIFNKSIVYDNPTLRLEVFESNEDGSIDGFAGKVEEHRWRNYE